MFDLFVSSFEVYYHHVKPEIKILEIVFLYIILCHRDQSVAIMVTDLS